MNWYLEVLKKYAEFTGRARRTEYWMFFLINLIIAVILVVVEMAVFAGPGVLYGIYMLAILLPALGVTVRRLHDTGRTGWWVLVWLIPIVGPIVILVFMVLDSQPGDNEYGPNPKTAAA
jgi:uncharacterized membrane protein YhaH (DUF805 family)